MLYFGEGKHYSFTAVRIMVAVFSAVGYSHAKAVTGSPLCYRTKTEVVDKTSEAALVINSACDKILRGDFATAQKIVCKSGISNSKSISQLRRIIDEYMVIQAQRKASRNNAYQTHIEKLEKLDQRNLSENINDISEVFGVVLKALEYADKEQKQALRKDSFVLQTVQKAKVKAAEFESKGRWLDAYAVCYSRLKQIYKDNEAYSDHSERLLEMADIATFLEDNPCETVEQRCAGIKKQALINAVDVLDSGYVNIVDYRQMAVKGIGRCELLAEVASNSDLNRKYGITNVQFVAWSEALATIANKVNLSAADMNKDKFIDVFEEILVLNESPAGLGLPDTLLIAQFAKGALSALDPYTVIYWPSQVQDFKKAVTNQFSGIGIKFSKEQGLTKVVSVLPDTPAYNSGLEGGDVITAVDGVETKNMSSDCVVKRIVGPEGTKVILTVNRFDEDKPCDITINRARIIVPSVHGWRRNEAGKWLYMIDDHNKIGYIRISSFNSETACNFERVVGQLKGNGLKGLILDLRSNPGGFLSSAIEIADKFIEEGLIVRTQPRFGISTYVSAHKDGTLVNCPVVVLINRFTASASEVLAGVLHDQKYQMATLVGERSYGKSSVQTIISSHDDGAQLKYTAAYYHLPSGQRVESRETMEKIGRKDWGISPDVTVELRSNELQNMAEAQKANRLPIKGNHNNASNKINRYSNQETIDADPQLAIGLLVLKSKMIQAGRELAAAAQQSDRGSGLQNASVGFQ